MISQLALHHLPEFWKHVALQRIFAILKPGGRFYLHDIVFSFNPVTYADYFPRIVAQVRELAGDELADDMEAGIGEEFFAFDTTMEMLLRRAGFTMERALYRDGFLAWYVCSKPLMGSLIGGKMNLPVMKNRSWVTALHEGISQLAPDLQAGAMKPAGTACAADLLPLCEKHLGREVASVEDLITGWNVLRQKRGLQGSWAFEGEAIRGIFGECGCPLVRSGLIDLHPVQCYCSQGLMETIFAQVAQRDVKVEIRQSIGRGDAVCDFVITFP